MSEQSAPPAGLLRYRLITGWDDAVFCGRVSEALELGYELYGPPALGAVCDRVVVAQAVVWSTARPPAGWR